MKIFCYMDDNLTEETGASLPTSENERASDTTNKMASPLFIDKRPSIGWTYRFIYRADGERWRRNQMQASIMLVGRTRNRTVQQLGHVRGRAKSRHLQGSSWYDQKKSEESADKQLRLMNTEVQSINVPKGYQSQETNVQSLILAQVDRRPAGSPAKNATSHYCQKRDT